MSWSSLTGLLTLVGMLLWIYRVKQSRSARWQDWFIGWVVSGVVLYVIVVVVNIISTFLLK